MLRDATPMVRRMTCDAAMSLCYAMFILVRTIENDFGLWPSERRRGTSRSCRRGSGSAARWRARRARAPAARRRRAPRGASSASSIIAEVDASRRNTMKYDEIAVKSRN